MTDYTELKRLADAAKNWGGEVAEDRWYTAECFKQPYFSVPDAEFIAACDPGSIRALISENERLESESVYSAAGFDAAREEIARLKAEIAGLKTGYEAYERVNAELKAENEALRAKWENPNPILIQCMDAAIAEQDQLEKDAARYRWTSTEGNWVARMFGKWRAHIGAYGDASPTEWYETREEAIDAAMGKGERS